MEENYLFGKREEDTEQRTTEECFVPKRKKVFFSVILDNSNLGRGDSNINFGGSLKNFSLSSRTL